jgi:dynein intermediate chain 2
MADYYTYQRKRKELGKPLNFSDSEVKIAGYTKTITATPNYVKRNPNHIDLDNIAEYSEHSVYILIIIYRLIQREYRQVIK